MYTGAMSNYLEKAILNAVFRKETFTSPNKVYVALYTADPTEEGLGTEVSGGAYQRVEVTFDAPTEIQVSGVGGNEYKAVIANSADLQFPVATASWGTITHMAIKDAQDAGNTLFYGPLEIAKAIEPGDRLVFLRGDLKLGMD